MTLPVKVFSGLVPEVIAIPFGFGHKVGGRWCAGIGENPAELVDAHKDPLTGASLWTRRVRLLPRLDDAFRAPIRSVYMAKWGMNDRPGSVHRLQACVTACQAREQPPADRAGGGEPSHRSFCPG